MKNAIFWGVAPCGTCKNVRNIGSWFIEEPHGIHPRNGVLRVEVQSKVFI
jgi:hypothetical protein